MISSPDKQQWEGFYSLDLKNNLLTLLFKQNAYICCGIWSHSGERVVLMGEHPAHQLLSYDLAGNDKRVVHSGSRQIRNPRRHVNGSDYLFSSGKDNYNVHLIDLSTKKELTQFNDSRHYVDLQWSPKGGYLVALTLNEIHLINVSTGLFEQLKIPQTQIKGVSFQSESSVAYSIKEHNQWQVYSYQLDTDKVLPLDKKWQFIQYHSNAENTLWLDQSNQLFFGTLPTSVIEQKVSANKLLNGRQFNLRKRGYLWFWFEREEQAKIQSYSEKTTGTTTLTYTEVEHFDFINNQLLFGKVQQLNSNIYQTQSHSR